MKCRNIVKNNIVWFGSIGKDSDGNKISATNYVDDEQAVGKSLTQKLNIIKGELWYNINDGLPLFDKIKSKGVFDAVVLGIIQDHPGVKQITSFKSNYENHKYTYYIVINTIYNELIEIES